MKVWTNGQKGETNGQLWNCPVHLKSIYGFRKTLKIDGEKCISERFKTLLSFFYFKLNQL